MDQKKRRQRDGSWVRGKCIGRGSFGTVNLAFERSNGAVFAVKSVDVSACHPRQIEAMENEIRILRSLSSPFVVEFLGDDETSDSRRNLHMEYMPGGTLADVAARGADVDERLLRFYTWSVVSALRYVHSRGIVHCDVKGRNVLVGPDRSCVKLADFGSAVDLSSVALGSPISPRGSPLWMAPEVIRGESQGTESDVWSLGCTIVEMVTGKPAWEDLGADTLSRIGFSDELPSFPSRLSELGRDFLGKCLVRDPARRWSCDQLLRHPYLQSASAVTMDTSPRCVLDWVDSEFDQPEDDERESELVMSNGVPDSAKERIGKLAGDGGANWETESGGWMTVRTRARMEVETWEVSLGHTDSNIIGSANGECVRAPTLAGDGGGIEIGADKIEFYERCNLLLLTIIIWRTGMNVVIGNIHLSFGLSINDVWIASHLVGCSSLILEKLIVGKLKTSIPLTHTSPERIIIINDEVLILIQFFIICT